MSAEVITVILSAAGLAITLGGGFLGAIAWLLRRMDERFNKVDEQFSKVYEEFNRVYDQFRRVDQQIQEVGTQLNGLRTELNDVKVSVARLEGPQPRLILPPH